jgi:hypothetical protein
MHGIRKDNSLIGFKRVQQIFICLDECRLLLGIELARYRLRFAMLHTQPVQQRDQAGAALVFDAKLRRDPGTNRAR